MRPLVLGCVLVIAGSSAAGQTAPDSASLAWTAYRAAEAGDRSQVADLQALLPPLLERKNDDGRYALGAVLDALWRLDARPALDLIPRIHETHPVEAIMFLTRFGAERDGVALALLRGARSYEWLTLANLMLKTRPQGFGEAIARELRVLVLITVSDDGGGISSRGSGPGIGCGVFGRAPGFPPLAAFRLTTERETGSHLLTFGPRPVYYERVPGKAGQPPYASVTVEEVTADDRLAYLSALLHATTLDVTGSEHHGLAWAGRADLSARIAILKRAADDRYNALLDTLASTGILDAAERRALRPQVQVELVDLRRDRSERLPAVQ
jgi:hypothetical protein